MNHGLGFASAIVYLHDPNTTRDDLHDYICTVGNYKMPLCAETLRNPAWRVFVSFILEQPFAVLVS